MTHPVYSPAAADPAELEAHTVGRADLLDTLTTRIAGAARDGARPHTMLIGPRGAGKTHTLRLVVHRSLADPQTAERTLPVLIPEDTLAIGGYLDLLVEIARAIGGDTADAARSMRHDRDAIGIEQAIMSAAAGRMLLLALENLDRVFHRLGRDGQGSLRAWVETSTAITIFATAPALFAGVTSRDFPWYGSFMVETLTDLTVPEVAELLAHRAPALAAFAETSEGAARIADIHTALGGSPRVWQMLADIADIPMVRAVTPAVEAVLDRLAPLHQARLWELPPSEQRLIVELARAGAPRTVSDLAAAVGVSNQAAAAVLGRLGESHWVTSRKDCADRRSSWYDLTDPLLRQVLRFRDR